MAADTPKGVAEGSERDVQGETPQDEVKRWLRELDASGSHEKKWRERADSIIALYKDERAKAQEANSAQRRFNILYANTEVLKGALYSRCPTPDIRRRWLDRDPVGRLAALILTRATATTIDRCDLDSILKECVSDMVLPGRAQVRVKYKPTLQTYDQRVAVDAPAAGVVAPEDVQQDEQGYFRMEPVEEVTGEEVGVEYAEWAMFRMSPAKRWEKVRWIAFGELLTRDDLVAQFGDAGKKVALKWMPSGMEDTEQNAIFKRALVWLIYNKTEKKCVVVSDGYTEAPLKSEDDPLKLEAFFPAPKPLMSIFTTDSMVPTPEYAVYQDHALDLDTLEERISVLTEALRRRGVHDAAIPELADLAKSGDNKFVPVKDWAKFMEKGGLAAAIQEQDLTPLAMVITELRKQAELKKQQIYEIIGISDIMRGATKATETLGAQKIKDQWGSVRTGPRQAEVQRFARDIIRLVAEVIAEHFSPKTLQAMTGIELAMDDMEKQQRAATNPQDPTLKRPTWADVMKVLRSDKLRGFKVGIETDSTIKARADEEQKNRVELITAVTGYLEKSLPAVQAGLVPKKVASELLMFGVRAFAAGAQLEEVLDEWASGGVDEMLQGGQPQQGQTNPAEQMQQQEMQKQAQHADAMRQADLAEKSANVARAQADAYAAVVKAEALEPGLQLDIQRKQIGVIQAAKAAAAPPEVAPAGATVQ